MFYPGPIRGPVTSAMIRRGIAGKIIEEGEVWLVERPVATIHTVTPITQWGTWDSRIELNLYDWARKLRANAQRQARQQAGVQRRQ